MANAGQKRGRKNILHNVSRDLWKNCKWIVHSSVPIVLPLHWLIRTKVFGNLCSCPSIGRSDVLEKLKNWQKSGKNVFQVWYSSRSVYRSLNCFFGDLAIDHLNLVLVAYKAEEKKQYLLNHHKVHIILPLAVYDDMIVTDIYGNSRNK